MADRIQLDGRTYVPIAEAVSITSVDEKRIRAMATEGKVLLRALGKKIYVDFEGLQAATGAASSQVSAPTPISSAPVTAVEREQSTEVNAMSVQRPVVPATTGQPIPSVPIAQTDRVMHAPPAATSVEQAVGQKRHIESATQPAYPMHPHSSGELAAMAAPLPVPTPTSPVVRIASVRPAPEPKVIPRMVLPPRQMMPKANSSLASSVVAVMTVVLFAAGAAAVVQDSSQVVALWDKLGDQFATVVTYRPTPGAEGNYPVANSPSELQAASQAGTFPAAATSSEPIYYVYNYPVIERVVQEVRYVNASSPADFTAQLNALYERIQSEIRSLNVTTNTQFAQQYQVIAQTNNIDKLGGVAIDNSTFTGGTVSGSTLTDIASLSVSGGSTLGSLTVGDVTSSGAGSFAYLYASSTSATSTFNGAVLATRAPTVPHTFSSWSTGASNSAWWDAALVINPSSAVGDSNLFSAAVNGSVKFLIDAEGDVFVNNLTSVGSVTLSTTSASSFSVEGNTTLGDSVTDTTTINGTLVVTGTTTASTVSGKFGIGTTTPWGMLSVSSTDNSSFPQFVVASSSATSFVISSSGNVGIGTTTPGSIFSVQGVGNFVAGATSTLQYGLNVPYLNVTGAVATSTFANGIQLTSGCFLLPNGECAGSSSTTGTLGQVAYFSATNTVTGTSTLTISSDGHVGIGTTSPYRKLSVTDTVAVAQASIAYDGTRDTQLQTDSSGDFVINPSGDDVRINDDNLWVCASGSCPTGTPSGTGNLVVETRIGVGTSTPLWPVTATNSTGPQIALTDGTASSNAWTLRSISNSLYIATSTASATSSTPAVTITPNGYVGIGTTSPSQQLATAGMLFVGANGASTLGTATSTFYGDIKIVGKLDVSTIDPVYTIDGVKFATYGHSTVGIKEEAVMKVTPDAWDEQRSLYEYTIDFDRLEKGSDLWLFYQVTDFGRDWSNLVVSLTPAFDGRAFYEENIDANSLTIYSSESAPVSVRFIASRYDFSKWPNLRPDQNEEYTGHVIPSKPVSNK